MPSHREDRWMSDAYESVLLPSSVVDRYATGTDRMTDVSEVVRACRDALARRPGPPAPRTEPVAMLDGEPVEQRRFDALRSELADLAAKLATYPEVPDGHEVLVVPKEVVDQQANVSDYSLSLNPTLRAAARAAVERRTKPEPRTERVRVMEAVEDRRKVPHPAEAAMPERLDDLGAQMLADSRAWFGKAEVHWNEVTHFALGLGGETGEVLDVIKKADVCGGEFADSCEFHAPGKHTREALADEMADVLTYLLALAASLDVDLLGAYRAKRAVNVGRWGDPEAPR